MSNTRNRTHFTSEAGDIRTTRIGTSYAGYDGRPRRAGRRGSGGSCRSGGFGSIINWARFAGFTLPTLGLFAALGGMVALTLGTGCASKKTPPADSSTTAPLAAASASSPSATALDVHPAPAGSLAYTPPNITLPTEPIVPPAAALGQDPVLTQTPSLASAGTGPSASPSTPPAFAASASATSTGATTYTVQKGDTLYKIARDHYGDGKKWSRIVAANPGLSPASLKAGQKLNLP